MSDYRAFTVEQAAQLARLPEDRLRRWATEGFLVPEFSSSDARAAGFYSFRNLVALRTVAALLRANVPNRVVKNFDGWFADHGYEHPWSTLVIEVWGDEPYFKDAKSGAYIGSKPPGQVLMRCTLPLAPIEVDITREVAELRARKPEFEGQLERRHSALYVKGTRVPTAAVWDLADAGYDHERIRKAYPDLTDSDIKAALEAERARREELVASKPRRAG